MGTHVIMYGCTYNHVWAYMWPCMNLHVNIYGRTCNHVWTYIWPYMGIHLHVCVCALICIHGIARTWLTFHYIPVFSYQYIILSTHGMIYNVCNLRLWNSFPFWILSGGYVIQCCHHITTILQPCLTIIQLLKTVITPISTMTNLFVLCTSKLGSQRI